MVAMEISLCRLYSEGDILGAIDASATATVARHSPICRLSIPNSHSEQLHSMSASSDSGAGLN